jgi:uncharacterized protein YodC (DUF2158 family)
MKSNLSFKVGDVVQLPSEDKLMTVESIKGDSVQCIWLDPNHTVVYHEFPAGVLVLPQAGACSKRSENQWMEN